MITREEIEKLAALSRITLTEEEKKRFQKEIDSILAYVGEIQKLSSDDKIERVSDEVRNVFREDSNPHESGKYAEVILKNTPQREGQYVKVKKIL